MSERVDRRRGQNHFGAKLTDREVDLLRDLYDAGGWSYRALAEKFEISKSGCRDLIKCKWRA